MVRLGLFDTLVSLSPIHCAIFRECTPANLIRLSKTCRIARDMIALWIPLAYDIEHFLSPYFEDAQIRPFRQLQATLGIIISGSAAMQFLDRTRYPGSDLDLYVEAKFADVIGQWLIECGYDFQPSPQMPTFMDQFRYMMMNLEAAVGVDGSGVVYGNARVAGVFDMKKGEQRIQLVCARRSVLDVVLGFHSTCVMNFITYNAAYALYPRSTFEKRHSLIIQSPSSVPINQIEARDKYQQRGWIMINGEPQCLSSSQHVSSGFGGMVRYVGDRYTWTTPLKVKNLQVPPFMMTKLKTGIATMGSGVIANSWKLSFSLQPRSLVEHEPHLTDDTISLPVASCVSVIYSSEVLKFTYVVSDDLPLQYFESTCNAINSSICVDAEFNEMMFTLYELKSQMAKNISE